MLNSRCNEVKYYFFLTLPPELILSTIPSTAVLIIGEMYSSISGFLSSHLTTIEYLVGAVRQKQKARDDTGDAQNLGCVFVQKTHTVVPPIVVVGEL